MVNSHSPFNTTEQSRTSRSRGRDTLLERLRRMRPLQVMTLATTMSLGVTACGESAPPPAKTTTLDGAVASGTPAKTMSPNTTPKNVQNKISAANIRLVYEVTNVSSAGTGKESQIMAISGDKISYRVNGTGFDGKPDNGYVLLSPSNSVFCQATCEPVPAAESTQLRRISIPEFIAPLEESTVNVLGPGVSMKPAPRQTIDGIKANCITFAGTALGFELSGTSCAAVDGGYLVHQLEKTNGLVTTFDLQSVRAAVAGDFPTH